MSYTNVFTGETILPSEVSYYALALTANVTLYWPQEAQPNDPVVAQIIDINSSTSNNLVITMPDARSASTGTSVLFNNKSAYTVIINNAGGTQIISIPPSTQWLIYLTDNSTLAGSWSSTQNGAATSTANASALAGSGIRAISSTLAQSMETTSFTGNFTLNAATDRARFYNFTGAGAGVSVTLPTAASAGSDWFFVLRNSATNSFTLARQGSNLIDGLSSLTFQSGDSAFIGCDGTNFYTIGLGQDPVFAFNYVTVNVGGGSNYVLSGSELNKIAYRFTGVLTANVTVIVPATVQQYWVYDNTTAGAFTLRIATQDQQSFRTPLSLVRGDRVIAYCDGTDVVATQASPVAASVNGGTF